MKSRNKKRQNKPDIPKVKKKSGLLGDLGRPFYFLWCGETISMMGTMLMEFALGVWVYQKTGSVLDFSGVILATALPALIVMPFAGSAADRFDRRYVMVAADCVTALMTLALAYLLWRNVLEIQHLYIFNMIVAVVAAFRMPAYQASVGTLLAAEQFTRASGVMGVSMNLMSMVAPMIAGGIMGVVGLPGIVSIDLVAFCLGSILVLKAFFHQKKKSATVGEHHHSSDSESFGGFASALSFFRREPLMLGLLIYAVIQQGLLVLASNMLMPLVLSHYSTEELGLILTCGGVGGLSGAAMLIALSGMRRLMIAVLLGDAVLALVVLLAGINISFIGYCVCAFVALFAAGFAEGCGHSLWMRKVPQQYQGRIFALIGTIMLAVTSVVVFSGGMLADKVFEPALAEGGVWEMTIGLWLGTGKGRGLGFMFVLSGGLAFFLALIAFVTPLRKLDLLVTDRPTSPVSSEETVLVPCPEGNQSV
ncbi:MAG: MFS transporter [Methylococcaceae bacterium]|nr:MFS transporter [Methylococcaceae bacterium]